MATGNFDVQRAVLLGECVEYAYHLYDRDTGNPDEFPDAKLPTGYELQAEIFVDDGFLDQWLSPQHIEKLDAAFNLDKPVGFVLRGTGQPTASSNPPSPNAGGGAASAEIIVAFRGTQTAFEWLHDIEFVKADFPYVAHAGKAERGFAGLYGTCKWGGKAGAPRLADALLEAAGEQSLSITGHSLGAALATLLALEMAARLPRPPHVMTFASPLVGNKTFAGKYDELVPDSWRVANRSDIVTALPPSLVGYTHVATEYPINSDHLTRHSWACWHALQTYLHLLDPSHKSLKSDCQL